MIAGFRAQSLYKVTVQLARKVEPEALQKALGITLQRYPTFRVELKHGLFRYYFTDNPRTAPVVPDDGVVLKSLNFRETNRFLFRVAYFDTTFSIDFYHCLGDGTPAFDFIKTLIYYYLKEIGVDASSQGIVTLETPFSPTETEDAFERYYEKGSLFKNTGKMIGENAYGFEKGETFKRQGMAIMEFQLSASALKEKARAYGTTITIFMGALLCKAIASVREEGKLPIMLFIPVNLRKYFPSDTRFNFVTSAVCKIPNKKDAELPYYIDAIKASLDKETSPETLKMKLCFTSLLAKLPPMRFLPVVIKSLISHLARLMSRSHRQTIIMSNIGAYRFAEPMADEVKSIAYTINCNYRTPRNCAAITLGDTTTVNFSRMLKDPDVEKAFAKELLALGLELSVTANAKEE